MVVAFTSSIVLSHKLVSIGTSVFVKRQCREAVLSNFLI